MCIKEKKNSLFIHLNVYTFLFVFLFVFLDLFFLFLFLCFHNDKVNNNNGCWLPGISKVPSIYSSSIREADDKLILQLLFFLCYIVHGNVYIGDFIYFYLPKHFYRHTTQLCHKIRR